MIELKWTQTAPGILALEGTAFTIIYSQHAKGDFLTMQGTRQIARSTNLAMAKLHAKWSHTDLIEIGAA